MKKVFYLYKSGTLKQKDYSLVLESKNTVDYIPIEQLDMIICFSEITLNKRVLSLLNKYEVSILFYNYYGNYIGRYTPKEYKDGRVLVNQVHAYESEQTRLYIAKTITISSVKNMLALVKYYAKKGKQLEKIIRSLETCLTEIETVESVEKLLLIEAKTKQNYYLLFDEVLKNEDFSFEKRTKNPPRNEVNALLSYGYAILYGLLLSVLDRSSLYPQISFIHSLSKNCDSLQFDLADIFKPVLIDRLVLRLIRKRQMKKSFFTYKADGSCYLNKAGIKVFVSELDSLLQNTIDYKNRRYSYRAILSKEVHKLSEYIKGNKDSIHPFVMKW